MKKILHLTILSFFALSCGGSGGGSSSQKSSSDLLPDPSDVAEEYSPLGLSQKVFTSSSKTYAPMDLLTQELTMTFDVASQTAKGHSVIKFRVKKTGRPYFELKATPTNIKLDSVSTTISTVSDPDGQSQSYLAINEELSPGSIHEVEFDYTLASGRVTFTGGGVRFLTDMTDLSGKFFEYWGPVGFEEDGFAMLLNLKVMNGSSSHNLRTNGSIVGSDSSNWIVTFPSFYSKSSFYVHLTNQTDLPSKKLTYKGLTKDIPIEIYGVTQTLVDSAVAVVTKYFAELEKDYGPYPHEKFLAYLNDRSGGMEYVGATITSVASIDHELLHSWFARSVIPADGRSGWIDEAMASWRDYGYSRSSTLLSRSPTNLANYSAYRKSTPSNVYVDGRGLMAELDLKFKSLGGLKVVMREFFQVYKNKIMNNEEFWHYLEEATGEDLSEFNQRYCLGESEVLSSSQSHVDLGKHPTPLTEEEILRLR